MHHLNETPSPVGEDRLREAFEYAASGMSLTDLNGRKAGGDLEQIKFLSGHSSVQTTERYLGSAQDIAIAVNDSLVL